MTSLPRRKPKNTGGLPREEARAERAKNKAVSDKTAK